MFYRLCKSYKKCQQQECLIYSIKPSITWIITVVTRLIRINEYSLRQVVDFKLEVEVLKYEVEVMVSTLLRGISLNMLIYQAKVSLFDLENRP